MPKREEIKKAIQTLNAQRRILGNDIADASIQALEKEISKSSITPGEVRKFVTILFADVVEFTSLSEKMDPEEAHAILKRYFSPWKDAVESYGGMIERFIGDGMLAVFGYPSSSEKDPENAIRAALKFFDGLHQLNVDIEKKFHMQLSIRVGISTGIVLIGEMTHPGEIVITGDTANLASRLQTLAPNNGILISHDTYRHVRGVFDVDTKKPVSVKGKIEPVQTYLIKKAKPRAFPIRTWQFEGLETQMIGRTREFGSLCQAFDDLFNAKILQTIWITGEAGVGKSRLLYEFDTWAELKTEYYRIFKGRASKHTRQIPYYLIRDMFAYRFQINESDSLSLILEKLEKGFTDLMGEGHIEKAHVIGHLIGYTIPQSPYLEGITNDPKQAYNLAIRYFIQFFKLISTQRPVIIQLEDVHWADQESLKLFESLSKACEHLPILMICCSRSRILGTDSMREIPKTGHAGEFYELDVKAFPHNRHLALSPLSYRESQLFILDILRYATGDIPDDIISLIFDKSQGNPFFIEELIKMMIEEKIIVITDEGWQINIQNLFNIHIPQTLFGILQARLDLLSPEERDVLKLASILGQTFWDGAISYLFEETGINIECGKIHDLLTQVQSKAFIFKKTPSLFKGEIEFSFKHALLHDVIYETVLKKLRTGYHQSAAKWLINKSGERAPEVSGLIAWHFENAHIIFESARWYANAGQMALKSFAPDTAHRYFRKSLALLKKDPETETGSHQQADVYISAYQGLGDLLLNQAFYSDALDAYSKMKQKSEAMGLTKMQILALTKIALVQEMSSDYDASLLNSLKAQTLLEQSNIDDTGIRIDILIRQSRAYLRLGNIENANQLIGKALEKCLPGKELDRLAQCYNVMGMVQEKFGRYEKSSAQYRKALELYRELGNMDWISGMLNNIAEMNRYCGRFSEALSGFQEALKIARKIGDRLCETLYISNIGGVLFEAGDYPGAEANLSRAISQAGDESAFFLPWTYAYLAKTLIKLSRYDAAAQAAKTALEMADRDKNLEFMAFAWNVSGQIAALDIPVVFKENPYSAPQCFHNSIQICDRIGMEGQKAIFLESWAEVERHKGNALAGHTLYRESREIYKKLGLIKRVEQIDRSFHRKRN